MVMVLPRRRSSVRRGMGDGIQGTSEMLDTPEDIPDSGGMKIFGYHTDTNFTVRPIIGFIASGTWLGDPVGNAAPPPGTFDAQGNPLWDVAQKGQTQQDYDEKFRILSMSPTERMQYFDDLTARYAGRTVQTSDHSSSTDPLDVMRAENQHDAYAYEYLNQLVNFGDTTIPLYTSDKGVYQTPVTGNPFDKDFDKNNNVVSLLNTKAANTGLYVSPPPTASPTAIVPTASSAVYPSLPGDPLAAVNPSQSALPVIGPGGMSAGGPGSDGMGTAPVDEGGGLSPLVVGGLALAALFLMRKR